MNLQCNIGLMLILLGLANVSQAAEPTQRPNMIVVLVDDLRWDELGCTGHPFAQTPHIDRIANEGARFRNAFCTTPLCSPSRACFLTGLHMHHHGILDNTNRSEQSHQLKTFPQALQKAGYETAYVGKWHMGNDDTARPGFDYWVSMKGQGTSFDPQLNVNGQQVKGKGHTTDVLNEHALAFVRREHKKPFCLYIAHKALHPELTQRDDGSITDPNASRFVPAERHEKLYANEPVPRRLNALDDVSDKPALSRKVAGVPPLAPGTETSDETIRDRQRMLAAVDDGVGMLLEELEKSGESENTVFVFTSDHGYWYGEHHLSVERRLAYEEGIRIPLLIRYPQLVKAGTLVDPTVLSIDLAPTLLELGKAKAPGKLDGRSLVPLLAGEVPSDWRTSFLIQYTSDTVFARLDRMGYQAIRTPEWKYIRYNKLDGMDELYHLQSDPYEMDNIIGQPNGQAALPKLQQQLDRLIAE